MLPTSRILDDDPAAYPEQRGRRGRRWIVDVLSMLCLADFERDIVCVKDLMV